MGLREQGQREQGQREQGQREQGQREAANMPTAANMLSRYPTMFKISVRKNDHHQYEVLVCGSTTVNELKTLLIAQIQQRNHQSVGSSENTKPFNETQIDIFSAETCKVLFGGKTMAALSIKPNDQLVFNIRQWTGGQGGHGSGSSQYNTRAATKVDGAFGHGGNTQNMSSRSR